MNSFILWHFRSIYLQASVFGIAHPRTCLVLNHLLHQQTLYIVFDTCSSFKGLLQYLEIWDNTKTIPLNVNVNFRKSRKKLITRTLKSAFYSLKSFFIIIGNNKLNKFDDKKCYLKTMKKKYIYIINIIYFHTTQDNTFFV